MRKSMEFFKALSKLDGKHFQKMTSGLIEQSIWLLKTNNNFHFWYKNKWEKQQSPINESSRERVYNEKRTLCKLNKYINFIETQKIL